MTAATSDDGDILAWREGAAGVIRLNRPKTINALTLEMVRHIDAALDDFEGNRDVGVILLEGAGERGLCAGGDIRSLYDSSLAGGDLGAQFWREEYRLNARIARFPKPYVAFMDGLVMGGGVGLSSHGSHRVVTDRTRLAMPEVGLGFFPDVGGTWLLSRGASEIGTFLTLTGQPIGGSDVIAAGLADFEVKAAVLPQLRQALTQVSPGVTADSVTRLLAGFAETGKVAPLAALLGEINALFAFDDMGSIVAALTAHDSPFARDTLEKLAGKSPRGMVVALKLLRLGRQAQSLEECLVREYRAAREVFRSDDFREGVRAVVVDKDRNPKWSPSRIEDVTPATIAPYFAEIGADELTFT
ncbi:MAG: enoyl-CoA hydratase/isomerase family protein [Alphaproteobacteria bacterium]|nr:enoyl-CoA hydratase/isomerase family protein [Alphaproteobacteria bacterium]